MKNLLQRIHKHRYFLLFILLFAYSQSIYSRMVVRRDLNIFTFTPEAAFATLLEVGILFLILAFFIRRRNNSSTFTIKEMLKIFGSSLIVFLLSMQLIGLVISLGFGTLERNFNLQTITLNTFTNLLDGFIYGSFFLAYYYYNKNTKQQLQMAAYNESLAEGRINQLKTQLNPHFLFNNLNVLDQLIEEDKHKASDFLNEFAEIYRYVLKVSELQTITLKEELAFAQKYFELIKHKYGKAYELDIQATQTTGEIVPLTLQLLLENAVQHNVGTKDNPIKIHVEIDKEIKVTNTLLLKRNTKTISGRALKNLNEQYKLLAHQPIKILQENKEFLVQVPIIQTKSV